MNNKTIASAAKEHGLYLVYRTLDIHSKKHFWKFTYVSSTVLFAKECQDPVTKTEEFINNWEGSRENNDKLVC